MKTNILPTTEIDVDPETLAETKHWIDPDTFTTKDGKLYHITPDAKIKEIKIVSKPIDKLPC